MITVVFAPARVFFGHDLECVYCDLDDFLVMEEVSEDIVEEGEVVWLGMPLVLIGQFPRG